MRRNMKVTGLVVGALAIGVLAGGATAGQPGTPLRYHAFTPYRAYDSRTNNGGTTVPAKVGPGFTATVCGAPTAEAFAVNLTVDQPEASGYLVAYPGNALPGGSSALNFSAGQVVANAAIVAADGNGCFKIGSPLAKTHVIVDINGWFAP